MAFQPVLNTISLFLEYQMPGGARVGNSLNVLDDLAGVTAPRVEGLVTLVNVWAQTASAKGARSNEVGLTRINARDMSVEFGEVVDFLVNPAIVGTVATPAMPANVTLSVKFGTGLAGRSARGRAYHVGIAEGMVSGDFVTNSPATNILAHWTSLRTALIADDFQLVVVSRQHDGVVLPAGVVRPVTQITLVDQRVDTQRRRLTGEGN